MSVSKKARSRGAILDEIMAYEREQLPKRKRAVPEADLRALADLAPETVSLSQAINQPGVSLIAECKKASPSRGLLIRDYNPVELAGQYLLGGARAISVLTNARYFQGSLDHLVDVKRDIQMVAPTGRAAVPVLRKDFLFDPYHIVESKAAGADALLLIAGLLERSQLSRLMSIAAEYAIEVLVEIHTPEELEKALELKPKIIGINNRNLQTFEVDFETTQRLRALIPKEVLVVGESGLKSAEDMGRMVELGVDAVLVGQSLVQSRNVIDATRALVKAGQPDP